MNNKAAEIINNFSLFNSWEEKYEYLIELGQEMPDLEVGWKKDEYLVSGCQSKVWLVCDNSNDKLHFYADSDALITKGIVAIIVFIYSGESAKEILAYKNDVFEKIGLKTHLSMTRANGLSVMLETINNYANKYLNHE